MSYFQHGCSGDASYKNRHVMSNASWIQKSTIRHRSKRMLTSVLELVLDGREYANIECNGFGYAAPTAPTGCLGDDPRMASMTGETVGAGSV